MHRQVVYPGTDPELGGISLPCPLYFQVILYHISGINRIQPILSAAQNLDFSRAYHPPTAESEDLETYLVFENISLGGELE